MSRLNSALIAAAMLVAASAASAGVCKVVNKAVGTLAAGATVQALMSAAPVTAVAHSSGGLILTGASGYLANTLGFVAGAWAIATAPVTVVAVGTAAVAGLGAVVACHHMPREAAGQGQQGPALNAIEYRAERVHP